MKRLAVIVGCVVALLVGSVALAPMFIDADAIMRRAAAAAAEALGREVRIGKGASLSLLPTPSVSFSDLVVEGDGEAPLATIAQARFAIALTPLLSDVIDVREAVFEGVTLALSVDADGRGNWTVDDDAPSTSGAKSGRGWRPKAVALDRGRVQIDSVTVTDQATGEAQSLEALTATLSLQAAGETLAELQDGLELALEIEIGSVETPRGAIENARLTLGFGAGRDGWEFGAEGRVTGSGRDAPARLTARLDDPLRALDGREIAFSVDALLGDHETSAAGTATLDRSATPPAITAALAFGPLDFSALRGAAPASGQGDGRLIPDVALPTGAPPNIALRLDLSAESVRLSDGAMLSRPKAAIALRDGVVSVESFDAGAFGGAISGAATLAPDGSTADLGLTLSATGLDAGLIGASGLDLSGGRMDASLDLRGGGATLRDAAATLGGSAEIRLSGGRIALGGAALAVKGLSLLLDPILGKSGPSPIRCGLSRWSIADGIATTTGTVLDARALSVSGTGSANLRSETIDMTFAVKPHDLSLMSFATPIRVTGPLSAPSAGVAPEDVLTTIATVGGVVVNPLGVVAALGKRGGDDGGGCATALKEGASLGPIPLDGLVGGAAEAVGGAAGDAVRGIGSGLKSLFGSE